MTYHWDYGNGDSSNINSPVYSYPADGQYAVTLIAISDSGCTDTARSTINIFPVPQLNFSNSLGCENVPLNFTNTSAFNSGSITYHWNFGDGFSSDSINPSHIYTNTGTYSVQLSALTDSGCADTMVYNVAINANPVLNF